MAARSRISIDPTSGAAARPRRRALRALAASAAALVAPHVPAQPDPVDGPAPACVLTPEQTEGPFFVDERLQRSDIRADARGGAARTGVPLALTLRLSAMTGGGCAPLRGAIVDVWHCDAAGLYSDEDALRTGGSQFLRGYQVSDANGRVRFATIYPGAYRGRAVHIHFKVRVARQDRRGEFTSQLYFDDRLTDRVHASAPYAGTLRRRTRNDEDGLFRAGGRALMLDVREAADGYVAAYDVGLRVG